VFVVFYQVFVRAWTAVMVERVLTLTAGSSASVVTISQANTAPRPEIKVLCFLFSSCSTYFSVFDGGVQGRR